MYCCVGLLIAGGIVCLILFFTTDVFEDEKEAEARAVNITGAGFPTVAPVTSPSPQATVFTPQPITPESTPSPTNAPTVTKQWQQVAGPFTAGNPSTKYGHAVALANDFLAIGEPLADFDDRGNVAIFQRSGNWRNAGLGFSLDTLQLGFSLDAANINGVATVVAGAVDTQGANQPEQFGSAHVFQRVQNGWLPVGDEIQPPAAVEEAGGEFGYSVAIASDVRRIAVGAPSSNLDNGKVYTYSLTGSTWVPMADPIVGSQPGKRAGESVHLSKSGSRLLVGSPGDRSGDGAVNYYEWTSEWKRILPLPGNFNSREGLGKTVRIISDDGRAIAFGGPSFGSSQGVVRVYEESTFYPGFFLKLGQDIVGKPGEMIGTTLAGAKNRVVFGTNLGSFRVYEYKSNDWAEISTGPTGLGSNVVSIDMTDDANTVVVGLENRQVRVFDLA